MLKMSVQTCENNKSEPKQTTGIDGGETRVDGDKLKMTFGGSEMNIK